MISLHTESQNLQSAVWILLYVVYYKLMSKSRHPMYTIIYYSEFGFKIIIKVSLILTPVSCQKLF